MIRTIVITIIIFTLTNVSLQAQWQQLPGPFVGSIQCMTTKGDSVYAATTGGEFYYSPTNGIGWYRNTYNWYFNAICASDNCLYGGTIDGIWKSTNNGSSWLPVNNGLPSYTNVRTFTSLGNTIFAGAFGKGIYKTINEGATWSACNTGIPINTNIISLYEHNNNLYAGTDNGKIYFSNNEGLSWVNITSPSLLNYPIATITANNSGVLLGTTGGGCFLLENDSTIWKAVNNNLSDLNIKKLLSNGDTIFAGTANGVIVSYNNGATWEAKNTGFLFVGVNDLVKSDNIICAGTPNGLYVSNNYSNTWQITGIQSTGNNPVKAVAILNDSTFFAGTCGNIGYTVGNGIYRSTDYGATWVPVNNGLLSYDVTSLLVVGNNIYAGTAQGVFKSVNCGNSWNSVNNGINGPNPISALCSNDTYIYACSVTGYDGSNYTGGIFRSSNGGTSWERSVNGMPAGHFSPYSLVANNSTIYVGTSNGIWISYNNGSNWGGGLFPSADVHSLSKSGSYIFAAMSDYGSGNEVHTSYGGWHRIVDNGIHGIYSIASNDSVFFMSTTDGVKISKDFGLTWKLVNTGLDGNVVLDFAIGKTVLTGVKKAYTPYTDLGVWSRPLNQMACAKPLLYSSNGYSVCQGDSIILSSLNESYISYLWNTTDTTSSINIQSTGNYYLETVDSNMCSAISDVVSITVNPIPIATISNSSSNDFCEGYSRILTASAGDSYLWSNGSINQSITVNESDTLSVTVFDNGCQNTSSELILTMHPNPACIISSSSGAFDICEGDSILLTVNDLGTYNWCTGETTQSITVYEPFSGSFNGGYYVYVTDTNGCMGSNISQPINALLKPSVPVINLIGVNPFCIGDSLILTVSNADSLLWNNNESSQNITVYADGIYIVTSIASNGCTSSSIPFEVLVNPLPESAGPISGTETVCQGQNSVAYTVPPITNATSYVWTISNGATGLSTTNSITVDFGTSATSGNITVMGSNSCGDGASSTLAITVNPLPLAAGAITGDATVCQGQNSVTYNVPTIDNATSYVWTLPSGSIGTSTTNSIDVDFGSSAISGNITVKGTNNCGDGDVSTLAITVNPLPLAAGTITGDATVCQGQNSVTYNVPTIANATSYVWTLPSGATGTSTTNSITVDFGTSASSWNIAVMGTNSCGDGAVSTLPITVNPLPLAAGTISGDATVCQGQNSVTYNVPTINNATSYVWTLPSGATGTSTTNSITVDFGTSASSGNISVIGTNSCGNGTISTLGINVNVKPITPIITLNGLVLQSNASSGNQWHDQNGLINGATNQNYTVTVDGDYYVIVSLLGCSSDPSNTINVTITGIEVVEFGRVIKVYPNPVSNELIIEIEGNNDKVNFDILNTIGQVVFKGNLIDKTTVQTSDFAPGVYHIKLENGKTFEFKKIIKE